MRIYVKAKPAAGQEKIERIDEDSYKVWVKEPAEKGKSNRAIVKLLAKYFNISPSKVKILAGHTARSKIIEVS
ncbi:MAG: hypothetical protein A3J48_03035 [Candidatus Doudnabacteria bacterium RIFCSPHIGHO2_02_FULL_46_11]|uniref:Uncharacterized protein n=1 Tax=Candidatus Doudnabacteria bacterium RIFCSPHIGHO2_02_FULL_46_11 TaxID=1817832 RepID=A0A1F5P5I2_9BACT|nr:MAG: hypothetical protein A3J48_03035 [Candidatus Doudnabacteria bacterium RIFCSPHIGHO2_02_FULL_46_11]